MVKNISQADIARALGLSQPAITKLKRQGMPVDSVEAAQAWREARQNVAARKPLPSPFRASVSDSNAAARDLPDEGRDAARTRREIAEANLAEIREAEERGELIRVDAVRSAIAGVIAGTRDSLMQIPARVAPVLAAEADAARVHEMLQLEINQALAALAAAPDRITRIEAGT